MKDQITIVRGDEYGANGVSGGGVGPRSRPVASRFGAGAGRKVRVETSEELLRALHKTAADARAALEKTSDEHLMTSWRLLARGQVVLEVPRKEMIQDTLNHWADDGVFAFDGRQGAGALRAIGRRQSFPIEPLK